MDSESLAFVLVGHIDHGKSTLIGRLLCDTGSLPEGKLEEIEAAARAEGREMELAFILDHLHEERERGITIDTAQTFFSSDRRDYNIIDAPGHKEFIKNMITGASQAEAAVLLCSVAEGVQEQTKRHAYVLRLLGLDQVIVAYNKMDLVGFEEQRFEEVREAMDAFLARIGVTETIDVPVSARQGDNVAKRSGNMAWYDGPTILEALDSLSRAPAPTEKALRFPIQDVYEREGGPIVAGRVESGVMEVGQMLQFVPGGQTARVERIVQFARDDMQRAEAGECIGVVFNGPGLRRGQVGCLAGDAPHMTNRFQASVFWLAPVPLRVDGDGEEITIQCATQEVQCRVAELRERIDSSTLEHLSTSPPHLEETEVGEMVLETSEPVAVESFYDVEELGRFVLVRDKAVVAGGIVTHPEG
jgi:sulfate adenylyltransferase large subunit